MFDDEEDEDEDKKRKKRKSFNNIFEEIQKMLENLVKDPEFFEQLTKNQDFSKFQTPSDNDFFPPVIMGWSVQIGPDGKPVIKKVDQTSEKPDKEKPFEERREPVIDILNQENEIVLIVETPGIDKNDIKLNTTEKEITIEAGKKFKKKLALPEKVVPNQAQAKYNNGLLEVRLPKKNKKNVEKTTENID